MAKEQPHQVAEQQTQALTEQPTPEPHIWGETKAYWCQTGLLFLTAVLAFAAIWSARIIERRKSAAGVIFQSRQDTELTKGLRRIAELHDAPNENIRKFGKNSEKNTEEAKLIRYVLNHFEYVSVGIQENIYDERIFKSSMCGIVVNLYERTKPFIVMVRQEESRDTIYQELEWLACRWKDRPLQTKKIKGSV